MKQAEIDSSIGKVVVINGFRDIGMDPDIRRIIGKEGKLIKRCKSGLLQIECEGKLVSLPPINIDLKKVNKTIVNLKCPHEGCIGTFHFGADTVGVILVNNAEELGPAHSTCPHCDNEVYFHTDTTGEGVTTHTRATDD